MAGRASRRFLLRLALRVDAGLAAALWAAGTTACAAAAARAGSTTTSILSGRSASQNVIRTAIDQAVVVLGISAVGVVGALELDSNHTCRLAIRAVAHEDTAQRTDRCRKQFLGSVCGAYLDLRLCDIGGQVAYNHLAALALAALGREHDRGLLAVSLANGLSSYDCTAKGRSLRALALRNTRLAGTRAAARTGVLLLLSRDDFVQRCGQMPARTFIQVRRL